jgi:hypothetical protein
MVWGERVNPGKSPNWRAGWMAEFCFPAWFNDEPQPEHVGKLTTKGHLVEVG